jgi:hypothetical protein
MEHKYCCTAVQASGWLIFSGNFIWLLFLNYIWVSGECPATEVGRQNVHQVIFKFVLFPVLGFGGCCYKRWMPQRFLRFCFICVFTPWHYYTFTFGVFVCYLNSEYMYTLLNELLLCYFVLHLEVEVYPLDLRTSQ